MVIAEQQQLTGKELQTHQNHDNQQIRNKRPRAIVGIGAAGNGKSTILDLIYEVICSKRSEKTTAPIVREEMSRIISSYSRRHGQVGTLVRNNIHLVSKGKYMPDEVINPLFSVWHEEKLNAPFSPQLFILGGFPRTFGQLIKLRSSFSQIVAIDQEVDQETSFHYIRRRLEEALRKGGQEIRSDDAGPDEVLHERWHEHCTHTPIIRKSMNGSLIELDRSVSLTDRLFEVFRKLLEMQDDSPLPPNIAKKCIRRLEQKGHPIHSRIKQIENPGK